MKTIEYGHHCFGDILRVGEVSFEDMSKERQIEIILLAAEDEYTRKELFEEALYSFQGEVIESHSSFCEQCGDWNSYTKIKLANDIRKI